MYISIKSFEFYFLQLHGFCTCNYIDIRAFHRRYRHSIRIFIVCACQQVIAAGSLLLPVKNSPLFSQMYSIRVDPRLSENPDKEKKKKERWLCQTRLSIPRAVIVIVVTAFGATVQKRTFRYERFVRGSRIYFARFPAHDKPRTIVSFG